jgi:predicted DNA-binding transcriptional regulator AlpA
MPDWQNLFTRVKRFGEDVAVPKSPGQEGSPRLMTVSEIAEEHGVSRVSIHTYRRRGTFPQPVEGEGTTRLRFRADEVDAFFKANPKQPGKRTDLAPEPDRGEPVTTTVDPRIAILSDLNDPPYNEIAEKRCVPWDEAVKMLAAYREAVVTEVVDALTAKGAELSELAEEEMRPSIEERAQTWFEAAAAAEKLKHAPKEASDA